MAADSEEAGNRPGTRDKGQGTAGDSGVLAPHVHHPVNRNHRRRVHVANGAQQCTVWRRYVG